MPDSKHKGLNPQRPPSPKPPPALSQEMQELNEKQRAFVQAFVARADGNKTEAARAAGYTDSENLHKNVWALFNNPKVRAAIISESRAKLLASAPMAIALIEDIATTPGHRKQLEALLAILNRSGLGERSEVNVNIKAELTVTEKWQALVRGKVALGQDVSGLLENLTKQERDRVLDGLAIDVPFEPVDAPKE